MVHNQAASFYDLSVSIRMIIHPPPIYMHIPVRAVIPRSLGTMSQRIIPCIPADKPAAMTCKTSAGYYLKKGEIKLTWQMRAIAGHLRRRILDAVAQGHMHAGGTHCMQ